MSRKIRRFTAFGVLAFGLGASGCGGSGGGGAGYESSPTPDGTCASGGGAPPEAPMDFSAKLVGSWQGALFADSYNQIRHTIQFRADGSCDWTDKHDSYYGPEKFGWSWSVSGAHSYPDWDDPWLIQLRPGPGDPMQPFTLRVVLMDYAGFTIRSWNEGGKDVLFDMVRVE
jgi:hypothetical protein